MPTASGVREPGRSGGAPRATPCDSRARRTGSFVCCFELRWNLPPARPAAASRSTVVGRKSGTRYVVPVAYTRHDGALLIGTPFGWARNLRTGTPVNIRLKGKQLQADVEVITDEPGVVAAYAIMAADNKNFASFNQIGFDADGRAEAGGSAPGVAAGARAFRLTPR